jgi:hypothetical protein
VKTIQDFKIEKGVAILEGVTYAEEAKIVDEYLRNNKKISFVSVLTKDGRNFELREGKLLLSNKKTFINPYFTQERNEARDVSEKYTNSSYLSSLTKSNYTEELEKLEQRVKALEDRISSYQKLLIEITLNSINNTNINK